MDTKKIWRDMGPKAFPEIAYIEWWDAVSEAGWETVDKTDVQLVLSIGFVVAEDDKAICIAAAISDEQSNSRMQIPKGMINSIKRVRLNKFLDIRKKKSKPKVQKPKVENSSNGLETSSSTPFIFPKTM
jgi:hypothetical protein